MPGLIWGDLLYILLGSLFFREAQFIRWIAVVTLWQIASIPQAFLKDIFQLAITFGIAEVGFNHKKINDYLSLPEWRSK